MHNVYHSKGVHMGRRKAEAMRAASATVSGQHRTLELHVLGGVGLVRCERLCAELGAKLLEAFAWPRRREVSPEALGHNEMRVCLRQTRTSLMPTARLATASLTFFCYYCFCSSYFSLLKLPLRR